MSKIPTSPSFLILFEHIKYDWNKTAPLHPFKTKNLRQLFTDHYTTFHELHVFCFGTRPRLCRNKTHSWQSRTWWQSRNSAKLQAVLPMAAKATPCFSWESAERKWEDPCVAEKTAVSIITPFPGTSTLGGGAARGIWIRLENVSWRIMVKIEHLGNQHPKSFCRCSFWRIFTGLFFRTALDFGPPKKHVGNSTNISCN